jgi:hypothetical protein
MDGLYPAQSLDKQYGDIKILDALGSGSPFFGKLEERMQLIQKGNYLQSLNDYYKSGVQIGYRNLENATRKMEAELNEMREPRKNFVIAVTHDVNVASFLAGKHVVGEFALDTWPHYLDAAVIIRRGREDAFGYFRWNLL